jgi:hypothetical protein
MTATIETVNSQEFGRCGGCGSRMDAQRAKDDKDCFLCEVGYRRTRPVLSGYRYDPERNRLVVDETAGRVRIVEPGTCVDCGQPAPRDGMHRCGDCGARRKARAA